MMRNLEKRLSRLEHDDQDFSCFLDTLESARRLAIAGRSPQPSPAPTLAELARMPPAQRALWQRIVEGRARVSAFRDGQAATRT